MKLLDPLIALAFGDKTFSLKLVAHRVIKQIDQRLHLSGAQWKAERVPQVLAHRCAYLNDFIGQQELVKL